VQKEKLPNDLNAPWRCADAVNWAQAARAARIASWASGKEKGGFDGAQTALGGGCAGCAVAAGAALGLTGAAGLAALGLAAAAAALCAKGWFETAIRKTSVAELAIQGLAWIHASNEQGGRPSAMLSTFLPRGDSKSVERWMMDLGASALSLGAQPRPARGFERACLGLARALRVGNEPCWEPELSARESLERSWRLAPRKAAQLEGAALEQAAEPAARSARKRSAL
jgi:hypothetical protein